MNNLPLYVASRASIPERARMWRHARDNLGWNITSSWIDEDGQGETGSFEDLWVRVEQEINRSEGLIIYAEKNDFPLKGAFIEAGMAIALGKNVAVFTPGVEIEFPSLRPIGSWAYHPECKFVSSMDEAHQFATTGSNK